MAINWDADPVIGDAYADVLSDIRDRDEALGTMGPFTGDTNIPTGFIRYNTTTGILERWSGSAWLEIMAMPTNYIGGLITSRDAGDTDHDVNITAGSCRDDGDAANMRLSSEITKQIDAVWSLGDDAGGLDTGTVTNDTMYAVWLIRRSDTGVVDALFSTSFTSPTMPTNYDQKRLIAAIKTDGSANIIDYVQSGDYFRYLEGAIQDVNDTTITNVTFETGTLSVPPSCLADIYGYLENPTATGTGEGRLWIRHTGAPNNTVTSEAWAIVEVAANFDRVGKQGLILVDGSRQIKYAAVEGTGSATVIIETQGFVMLTRREP
jgi:hypothetical protein